MCNGVTCETIEFFKNYPQYKNVNSTNFDLAVPLEKWSL